MTNLKALQVTPVTDKDRKQVYTRPGDTNLKRMAMASWRSSKGLRRGTTTTAPQMVQKKGR